MDEGKEIPTPTPSKKELKRQRKLDQQARQIQERNREKRRLLLKAGGVGLLGIAASAFGLNKIFQTREQYGERTNVPALRKPTPETLSPEHQIILKRLFALNQEVLKRPKDFKELAPQIGNLAIEYFSREMGYDPKRYEGKLRYLWNDEYQKVRDEESGCIIQANYDDEYGSINAIGESLRINLTKPYIMI